MLQAQPLNTHFNVAAMHLANVTNPRGSHDPIDSLADLRSRVVAAGRMVVWDGASDRTVFGSAEYNYAFRA